MTKKTLVIFYGAIVGSGLIMLATLVAQQPHKQQVPAPVPDPVPNYNPSELFDGLDPIDQRRMKDRIRVHELEQKFAKLERESANLRRLVLVQIRQIQQLQRYTFGIRPGGIGDGPPIGSDGQEFGATADDAVKPIETPDDLIPDENGGDSEQ